VETKRLPTTTKTLGISLSIGQSKYDGSLDGQISGGFINTEVEGAIDFSKDRE
jgi:hypothetical protein